MLAALRRAGSALPKYARSRLRELLSRRRCLPAEPEGADMTRGQSLAVTVAASTRQTRFQQLASGNCGIFCQLPSSLHVDGASK